MLHSPAYSRSLIEALLNQLLNLRVAEAFSGI